MKRTAIFGAGGFGREVFRYAASPIFVSDTERGEVHGIPLVGLDDLDASDEIVVAVSAAATRRQIVARCKGRRFGSIIASNCEIGPGVELGVGAILCSGVILTADMRIGDHFQANIRSAVGHDVEIGDFGHISCNVIVNGNVHMGDDVYMGTGSMVRNGVAGRPVIVGDGAVIGMGAIVTKDVAPRSVMVGNPARPLERPPLKAVS